MTIEQLDNVVNIIDETRDAGEQIVSAIPLDWVAIPQARNPQSDKIIFKSSSDDNVVGVDVDGLLLKDINGVPTPWTGTLDELANKINDDYLVGYGGGGGTFPPDYANSALQEDGNNLTQETNDLLSNKALQYWDLSDAISGGVSYPFSPASFVVSFFQAGVPLEAKLTGGAIYDNIDELIAGWNSLIESVSLEKRDDTSFYIKPNKYDVSSREGDRIVFTAGLPATAYLIRDLKEEFKGAENYSSLDVISKNIATLLDNKFPRVKASVNISEADSGNIAFPISGVSEIKYYSGQQGEEPITYSFSPVNINDRNQFVDIWNDGVLQVLPLVCEQDPLLSNNVILKPNKYSLPLVNAAYIEVNSGATIRRYSLPNWVISMQGDVLLTTEERLLEENIKANATRSDYYIYTGNTATALAFSDGSAIAEGTFGDIISITDDAGGAIYYSLNGVDPIADPDSFPRINGNSGNQSFRGLRNIDLSKVRIIGETGGSRGYFNFTYNKNKK